MITLGNINEQHKIFENDYIALRDSEARLLSLDEIRRLPEVMGRTDLANEWQLRRQSFKRFDNYLSQKNFASMLDLACGNGWFINRTYNRFQHATGMDINLTELKQADEILSKFDQVSLIYGDIFSLDTTYKFDLITINAGIQYFESLNKLIDRLLLHLNAEGEIHILDSPFYNDNKEKSAAKDRTSQYYRSQNAGALVECYHHHLITDLEGYNFEVLYNGMSVTNKLKRKLGIMRNPFPWIKIT